jgi:hypothetical protein
LKAANLLARERDSGWGWRIVLAPTMEDAR